jgi:hypothetical protein
LAAYFLSAAKPQLKLGVSPAKTPRAQRSEYNAEEILQENSSFLSELGVLCALAGVNPHVLVFQIPKKLCKQRKFQAW